MSLKELTHFLYKTAFPAINDKLDLKHNYKSFIWKCCLSIYMAVMLLCGKTKFQIKFSNLVPIHQEFLRTFLPNCLRVFGCQLAD